jgi:hypothetical protein
MATITSLAGGAVSRNTPSRQLYYIENDVNFATAATAKGSALAAADIIEAISVPAGTVVLNAGIVVVTAVDSATNADARLDLGVTGVDADVWVDGFDIKGSAVGVYSQNPAAYQPVVVGATADTIDVLIQAATTAPATGVIRVWALLMDVSDRLNAAAVVRDTSI